MTTEPSQTIEHQPWLDHLAQKYPSAMRNAQGRFEAYADAAAERNAAQSGPALIERGNRCLIQLTGKDRATWLHGLTTNHVTGLDVGVGNYAFICNVQGRIVADPVVIAMKDAIWLDLDVNAAEAALAHMRKVLIVEDVTINDDFAATARMAVAGDQAAQLIESHGATHVSNLPHFGALTVSMGNREVTVVRNETLGLPMYDLFVPAEGAAGIWDKLCEQGAVPVGTDATEAHRILRGRPAFGREISDEYLPAETRQLDLAVSFNKGCYLGQEIVARMHAHDAVARLLIAIEARSDQPIADNADIRAAGKVVGEVTSAWHDSNGGRVRALGYVKAAAANPGNEIEVCSGDDKWSAQILDWPPK
ncbi:MAG: YgfZ/GcvT domain-containing protein [Phycisphaerae bacterium]